MYIEFLLEESSAEAALRNLLPDILGERVYQYMEPHRNRSHSFQVFLEGLNAILEHGRAEPQ